MTDDLVTEPLYGNYRAKVINNVDKEFFGQVMVYIPDLMQLLPSQDKNGLWARPANNPIGGRNTLEGTDENHFMGSSYIPRKGAWIWIFFEAGNINRPYYFGALDIEHAKVLAENQTGTNFQDKWTIFKSHAGRTVVISDDPDDERVEITGKKRLIAEPPSGDEWSVFAIERNQTVVLLDERTGQEKLLIKTYKGDFINIDIENQELEIQFAGDVHIKNGGNFYLSTAGEMHILSGKSIIMTAKDEINIGSGHRMNIESGEEYNRKVIGNSVEQVGGEKITTVGGEVFLESGKEQHIRAGGDIYTDATDNIFDNTTLTKYPPNIQIETLVATVAKPNGDRNKEDGEVEL